MVEKKNNDDIIDINYNSESVAVGAFDEIIETLGNFIFPWKI